MVDANDQQSSKVKETTIERTRTGNMNEQELSELKALVSKTLEPYGYYVDKFTIDVEDEHHVAHIEIRVDSDNLKDPVEKIVDEEFDKIIKGI